MPNMYRQCLLWWCITKIVQYNRTKSCCCTVYGIGTESVIAPLPYHIFQGVQEVRTPFFANSPETENVQSSCLLYWSTDYNTEAIAIVLVKLTVTDNIFGNNCPLVLNRPTCSSSSCFEYFYRDNTVFRHKHDIPSMTLPRSSKRTS